MSDTQVLGAPSDDTLGLPAPGSTFDEMEADGFMSMADAARMTSAAFAAAEAESEIDDEYDGNATLQEEMARREAKEAAQDTPEPQVEVPEAKGDEKPAAADVSEKAKFADQIVDALHKRPEAVAEMALQAMSADAKASFLKSLGFDAAAPAKAPEPQYRDIDDDYVPAEGMEEALKDRWSFVRDLPKLAAQVAELQANIGNSAQEARNLKEPVGEAMYHTELSLAMLETLCEAIGINLPHPDPNAVIERLKDGRTTMRSAIRSQTTEAFKKSLTEFKQGRNPRPQTPGNNSTHGPRIKEGATMAECSKALGFLK